MPFEKGKSGNPEGRRLEQQGQKMWRDALRIAVEDIDPKTKKRKLERIAEAVIDAAMAGDMTAAKEIGDRLDGKPRQEIDAVVAETRYVARIPEPAKDAQEWLSRHTQTPPIQ
ncbi:MAG: hypothetical protein INF12_14685 [Methylobacterium sp.]|nr:hypothetical protein [Methylobacterium sp.]